MNLLEMEAQHHTRNDDASELSSEVETTTTTSPKNATKEHKLEVALNVGQQHRKVLSVIRENKDWLVTLRDDTFRVSQGDPGIAVKFTYYKTPLGDLKVVDYAAPPDNHQAVATETWEGKWSDFIAKCFEITPRRLRQILNESDEESDPKPKKPECKRCGHSCKACRDAEEAKASAEAEAELDAEVAEAEAEAAALAKAMAEVEANAEDEGEGDEEEEYEPSSEEAEATGDENGEELGDGYGDAGHEAFDAYASSVAPPTPTFEERMAAMPPVQPQTPVQQPKPTPTAISTNLIIGSPVVQCHLDFEKLALPAF